VARWAPGPAPYAAPLLKDATGQPAVLSSSLVRQCYSLLKAILNIAVSEELIDSDPCRIRGASQNRYAKPEYMSPGDARSIIAQLDGDTAVLATLALATGCRLGELLALTWADVNLAARLLHVRRAAVEVDGRQVLTTLTACSSLPRALPSGTAKCKRAGVEHVKQSACPSASITYHTALTTMAYDGKPIQEIRERAGHASFVAAMNYQRLAPRAQRIEGARAV